MGERKVLNKYYPPDWDPSTLTKTIKPKNGQVTVRLMLPMSIQCQTCGEYIHKGKKFNGRKEEAIGEAYLGIKVWRFYLKCTTCLSELTFKTDPKRNDYTVENGASRNFEPWKQQSTEAALEAKKKAREESGDNMKVLENRSEASKREMDISDAIEEVRELNARAQALSTDQLLDIHSGGAARWEEAQIEEMAAKAFAAKRNGGRAITANGDAAASAAGSSAAADSSSATATSASSSSAALPVLRRLPDAVDLAAEDFRPAVAGALDALEVPDSPTNGAAAGAADGAEPKRDAAVNSTTAASTAAAAPAATPAAPSPLAGLVLVKKRKADDGDKEKKKKLKKERKEAEKKAANGGGADATAAPAASGLGGLLGSYADDSD